MIFSLLIKWQVCSTLSSNDLMSEFQSPSRPFGPWFVFLKVTIQESLLILACILLFTTMSPSSSSVLSSETPISRARVPMLILL